MRRPRTLPIVLTIALGLWVRIHGQEPFRAGTTLVPVDVRVVDRDGKLITDLTAADFTVLEDGVKQPIVQFSTLAFTPDASALPTRVRRAADAFERTSANQRTFLIVLGRGNLQPPSDGVDAVLHFVRERLLPQDLVAVIAWNRATDFTSDRAPTLEFLERFKARQLEIELQILDWSTSLAALYSETLPEYIQRKIDGVFGGPFARNTRTLGSQKATLAMQAQTVSAFQRAAAARLTDLERFEVGLDGKSLDQFMATEKQVGDDLTKLYFGVEYLRHLSGEKHLLFFTESGLSFRVMDNDHVLGRLASDGRVVFDVVQTGGIAYQMPRGAAGRNVGRNLPLATGGTIESGITARTLTGMTGGRFFANKFPKATTDVDLIDQSARFSYVLGYAPVNQTWDGRYRHITVKVNRPGLTALSRDGYYARRELGPLDRRSAMVRARVAAAAEEPRIIPDLPVTEVTATPHGAGRNAAVSVELKLDISRVEFEKRDNNNVASVDVAAFGVKGPRTVGQEWTTLELTYTDERLAQVQQEGLRHTITMTVSELPAGVKVVAYDYGADLLGSAVAKIK